MKFTSDDDEMKSYFSDDYNFTFDKITGQFCCWGKTIDDDPVCAPSPDILDIEVSSGLCNGRCDFCYKGNGVEKEVKYMDFVTYKKIFDKLNLSALCQIAFGLTYTNANPDFWDILGYTRSKGIIPNYTTNGIGLTDLEAKMTVELCGAVACSIYKHTKEQAYNAIERFVSKGMSQVNAHFMLSQETFEFAFEVLADIKNDQRLKGLNAIVFLQYKDKNKSSPYHTITDLRQFKEIVDYCLEYKINFGFDSCSSSVFMKSVIGHPREKEMIQAATNCESSLGSGYINVDGIFFPCSFLEGTIEGINVLEANDFVKEVWNNEITQSFRSKLLETTKKCNCKFAGVCRSCPAYDLAYCKES